MRTSFGSGRVSNLSLHAHVYAWSRARLWQAITDLGTRACYQFGAQIESSWAAGCPYQVVHPKASRTLIERDNHLEVDPPRRLVQSYRAVWDDDVAAEATSRVTRNDTPQRFRSG